MCTNRVNALDPAVKRRAADIFIFERPNKKQRFTVLEKMFSGLGLSPEDIEEMVKETGKTERQEYGFTFSDLIQRLFPAVILDSYPYHSITPKRAIEIARKMIPSPPFQDNTK